MELICIFFYDSVNLERPTWRFLWQLDRNINSTFTGLWSAVQFTNSNYSASITENRQYTNEKQFTHISFLIVFSREISPLFPDFHLQLKIHGFFPRLIIFRILRSRILSNSLRSCRFFSSIFVFFQHLSLFSNLRETKAPHLSPRLVKSSLS